MKTQNQTQFHAALVAAYSDLFVNDPRHAYAASKDTPEGAADKMLAACIAGLVNLDGEGIKRACKACGIPPKRGAVFTFVGHVFKPKAAPVAKPAPRKVQIIGLSNILSAMSGVARISRAHDLVCLEYVNGTRESGNVTDAQWAEGAENPLRLVSLVQSQRRTVSP